MDLGHADRRNIAEGADNGRAEAARLLIVVQPVKRRAFLAGSALSLCAVRSEEEFAVIRNVQRAKRRPVGVIRELEAQIRSLTRRKFIQENICLTCGRISFDTKTRLAQIDHMPLSLTRKESSLLEYFLLHPDRVISPEELIEHIWDGSVNSFSNSIRVHISSLRKKLRAALGYDPIQNKIGEGYLLNADCCND